ncbi:hypothetical protein J4210_05910 [Candidatus Woesearchaeota archaeon]|nr:hypothetical protein [Candidatus Woesearchaeota archaeon]
MATPEYRQNSPETCHTSLVERIGGGVETFWGNEVLRRFPQYRFFFVPLYKALGGKERPVLATMSTFAVSTIIHNPFIIPHISRGELNAFDYLSLLLWMGSGTLISYVKHKKRKKMGLEQTIDSETKE